MSRVGNWVGQTTSTTGVNSIVLDGLIDGYAPFSSMGDGEVYYSIADGDNREAGIGTLDGNVLHRTYVKSTLVSNVLSNLSTPLNLSGEAYVFCTFNKDAFDSLLLAATSASEQTFVTTPSLTPILPNNVSQGVFAITALSSDLAINAPVGQYSNKSKVVVRIKDDGVARLLSFDSIYRQINIALPPTTIAGKLMYFTFQGNAYDDKWDFVDYKVQI